MIDNRCNLNNDYTERILYIEFNMYRPRMFFFFFFFKQLKGSMILSGSVSFWVATYFGKLLDQITYILY